MSEWHWQGSRHGVVASAVGAGQGEAIAALLSLMQIGEDIGMDKKRRTDRLGVGEWLAGHRRPSQTDKSWACRTIPSCVLF